jgi:hypothetical protein
MFLQNHPFTLQESQEFFAVLFVIRCRCLFLVNRLVLKIFPCYSTRDYRRNLESHEALVGCFEKDGHEDNVLEMMLSCSVRFWMERICILCGTSCYWS